MVFRYNVCFKEYVDLSLRLKSGRRRRRTTGSIWGQGTYSAYFALHPNYIPTGPTVEL